MSWLSYMHDKGRESQWIKLAPTASKGQEGSLFGRLTGEGELCHVKCSHIKVFNLSNNYSKLTLTLIKSLLLSYLTKSGKWLDWFRLGLGFKVFDDDDLGRRAFSDKRDTKWL